MLAEYAAVVGGFFCYCCWAAAHWCWDADGGYAKPGLRLLIVLLALSLPSFALERRHAEFVTVAANETVDDTLVAAGNTVRVEGVVNGDLLAFARTVEVRGTVKGDLVSFAKRTVVSGTVEGHIYNFSQSFDLDGQLGHSIYGLVQSLRVDNRGHVGDGIVVGAGDVNLEGEVKRSVNIFTGNADVSGSIGRELTMAGGSLTLTNTARVGGNLSARVRQLKDVHIADGATIAGKRDIQVQREEEPVHAPQILLPPSCLVRWRHAGGMAGPGSVSRLLPGHDSGGGLRLAQPGARGWGSGRACRWPWSWQPSRWLASRSR